MALPFDVSDAVFTIKDFVPTDIDGCVLWLRSDLAWQDAAKTVPCTNESLVWVGEDKSGNGADGIQVTEAARPVYLTNQINGHPAWRFDGIDDWLDHAQLVLNSGFSAFYVVKATTDCFLGTIDDGGARQIRYNQVANKFSTYDGANNPISDLLSTVAGNWLIGEFVGNGANVSWYENGVGMGSGACVAMEFGQISVSSAAPINGDVVEILIYNSALSDPNRTLVENYLNGRYAIY